MRDHIITCVATVIRSHPECGVIITGDFNQLQDNILRTHYRFVQVVEVVTRGQATLDKIWTNMVEVYTSPFTISELGTSVLWEPKCNKYVDTGKLIYVTVRCMGPNEKETFAKALPAIKWEALYRLETCEEQYAYYQIDNKQFGGISGTSITDVLLEMVNKWYESTDNLDSYVRVVMLDFSKAFDLINHCLLLYKLQLPEHIIIWMAAFLLDRSQRVKIGKHYSQSCLPNGGVPQGTLSAPKCFLVYINDLETPVHLYKYMDDSTLFEVCERNGVSLMQESVDIAAKWTEDNFMKHNKEKSKELIISFAKKATFVTPYII